MDKLISNITDAFKYILSMGWSDVLDVLLVAAAVYAVLGFIRRTNSSKVANGIVLLLVATWLSSAMKLYLTNYILRQVFELGFLAVIILFQPELRRVLERVGSYKIFNLLGQSWGGQAIEQVIMQTVYACEDMSKKRTGALIVFERQNHLNGPLATGTAVDALVSAELLKNIFYDKSPLHDGAVIIQDGRLAAAGCMLPLSSNANLSRDLGMRHRAGLGMSEQSDAVVVIVSEETGAISVAVDGLLKRHLSTDTFEDLLRREILPKEETSARMGWLGRLRQKRGGGTPDENSDERQ